LGFVISLAIKNDWSARVADAGERTSARKVPRLDQNRRRETADGISRTGEVNNCKLIVGALLRGRNDIISIWAMENMTKSVIPFDSDVQAHAILHLAI
jgi:thiamine monophosphate kinase